MDWLGWRGGRRRCDGANLSGGRRPAAFSLPLLSSPPPIERTEERTIGEKEKKRATKVDSSARARQRRRGEKKKGVINCFRCLMSFPCCLFFVLLLPPFSFSFEGSPSSLFLYSRRVKKSREACKGGTEGLLSPSCTGLLLLLSCVKKRKGRRKEAVCCR